MKRQKRQRDLFGRVVRSPREDKLHKAIVEYLQLAAHPRLLYWHTPNSALIKPGQRIYFAQLGVLPGMADFCFVLPLYREPAFMELKARLGILSEAQQAFQARCAVLGLRYRVCRDLDSAIDVLREWHALKIVKAVEENAPLHWEPDRA